MIRPATLSAISFPRVSLPRAFVDKRSSDQIYLNNRSWIECAMAEKRKQRTRTVPGELGRSTNANNSNYRFVGVRSEKRDTSGGDGGTVERSSAIGPKDLSQPRAQQGKQKKDGEDLQVREGGRRGNNNDSQGSPL